MQHYMVYILGLRAVNINIMKGMIDMKKFLGVIVAVAICVCFAIPCFAVEDTTASSDSSLGELASMLENGGASLDELNKLLQNEDLMAAFEDSDIAALFGDASNGDTDALAELESAFAGLGEDDSVTLLPEDVTMPEDVSEMLNGLNDAVNSTGTTAAEADTDEDVVPADTTAPASSILDSILAPLSAVMDVAPFEKLLEDADNSDIGAIINLIASVMTSEGIDFASFTSADVGAFDIANLLTTTDKTDGNKTPIANLAESATDVTAGLADTLISGLEGLGLDTKTIEGLLDNEIVNFFANMYIGFIGKTEQAPAEETTAAPAVVTTTTPKTGDTASVFVAIATLFVSGTAAGVCLKKKENV